MKKESIIVKAWRVIYPMGIHFGISYIISIGLAFVVMVQIFFDSIQKGVQFDATEVTLQVVEKLMQQGLLITLIASLITIPIMLIFYKRDKKRQFFLEEKKVKFGVIDCIIILLLAISSCLAFNNLISISNIAQHSKAYQQVSELLFNSTVLVEIITVGIFAPIAEELVFRGLIYKRLKEYTDPLFGMLFSSFLFGLYHGNIVQGIYAFCLGLILVFLMEKYKSVKAPVLAHMGANIISVLITEYSILSITEQSKLAFGIVTIVCIIITVALLMWLKKRKLTTNGGEESPFNGIDEK